MADYTFTILLARGGSMPAFAVSTAKRNWPISTMPPALALGDKISFELELGGRSLRSLTLYMRPLDSADQTPVFGGSEWSISMLDGPRTFEVAGRGAYGFAIAGEYEATTPPANEVKGKVIVPFLIDPEFQTGPPGP
jgi:hypothetical protein